MSGAPPVPVRAPAGLPGPVRALVAALPTMTAADLLPAGAPARTLPGVPRAAAVLVLLSGGSEDAGDAGGDGPGGLRVVLIERSARGVHGGQAAFPGGGAEAGDATASATALREAAEEVGLDPAAVDVLGVLPALPVPVSGYLVTPVLAWQADPSALVVGDPAEVVAVHRVPLAVLADPARRVRVRGPVAPAAPVPPTAPSAATTGPPAAGAGRWYGPGFALDGLLVWGFTALLLDALLRAAGLERAWGSGPGGAVVDAPVVGRGP